MNDKDEKIPVWLTIDELIALHYLYTLLSR